MSDVATRIARSRLFTGIYGASKIGKTFQLGRAYGRARWIGNQRGLQGLPSAGVIPVAVDDLFDIDALRVRVREVYGTPEKPNRAALATTDSIVADDLNLLIDRTVRVLSVSIKDGRAMFNEVGRRWRTAFDEIEALGLRFAATFHERYPDEKGGMGGPSMPTVSMSAEMPKYLDLCYRMVGDGLRQPWPAQFWTNRRVSDSWILGERRSVSPLGVAPPNLGEILRMMGEDIQRSPEIEPLATEWVEKIAQKLLTFDSVFESEGKEFAKKVSESLLKKKTQSGADMPLWGIDWILQDAIARAELRKQQHATSTLASLYGW